MPSPDRCPRCDRAECPWHLLPDPDSDDDRALFSADRARADANCRAHELTIEQWRAEALALRTRLASPPGSTVGAALADPRVQTEGARVELHGRSKWHQIWRDGHRFSARTWTDGAWSLPRSYSLDAIDIAAPARVVAFADRDLSPDSRGPLAPPPSLAPLRARAEALLAVGDKATPGPWHNGDTLWGCGTTKADGFGEVIYTCAGPAERARADAAAIAALRDAPALIRDLLAALGDNLPTKET